MVAVGIHIRRFPFAVPRPWRGRAFAACLLVCLLALPGVSYAEQSLFDKALAALRGPAAQTVAPPASVEVAFSPNGGGTALVIQTIRAAKKEILVAAYAFTSEPIAEALIAAHAAGIDVKVVIDRKQVGKKNHSVAPRLIAAGVPLRVDIIHNIQHNKFMVIDRKTVETGSFNFTASGERYNAENILVLKEAPELAAAYADTWQKLWDKAERHGER